MFSLTGNAPEAESLFAHATSLLGGRDPRELVQDGDESVLYENRVAQILCCLQALAAMAVLRSSLPDRRVVAGYSVGEVAAWGVAGCLSPIDTLDVVARRAELMDSATTPGDGLLAVRGLPRAQVAQLCERHGVSIAIVNPDEAFIIGGSAEGLRSFSDAVVPMKAAKIVRLHVGVASHTHRLESASSSFGAYLQGVHAKPPPPGVRLLSGIDGASVVQIDASLYKLSMQISHTVEWAACLQACIEAGATAFLELGPGPALSGMASALSPHLPARSVDEFRTLQGLRDWIASRASG